MDPTSMSNSSKSSPLVRINLSHLVSVTALGTDSCPTYPEAISTHHQLRIISFRTDLSESDSIYRCVDMGMTSFSTQVC
jgi:hypothetical protein